MAARKPCKRGKVRRRVKGGRMMCVPKKRAAPKRKKAATRKASPKKKRVMRKKTWLVNGKYYSPNSRRAAAISFANELRDYEKRYGVPYTD